jgi:hypothetical protein
VPPDYLVHQRSNGSNATVDWNRHLQKSEQVSEQAPEGASDSEQCLSGAAPDCPVPHEDKAPTVETIRTLTVGWRGWRTGQCPVAHRTIRCAHRQHPAPTVELVVGGYKYPHPPPLQPSKHSSHSIQYKSKTQHSKTQIKPLDLIKVPKSILVIRTCEKIVLVFLCCSCCLVDFLLPHSLWGPKLV